MAAIQRRTEGLGIILLAFGVGALPAVCALFISPFDYLLGEPPYWAERSLVFERRVWHNLDEGTGAFPSEKGEWPAVQFGPNPPIRLPDFGIGVRGGNIVDRAHLMEPPERSNNGWRPGVGWLYEEIGKPRDSAPLPHEEERRRDQVIRTNDARAHALYGYLRAWDGDWGAARRFWLEASRTEEGGQSGKEKPQFVRYRKRLGMADNEPLERSGRRLAEALALPLYVAYCHVRNEDAPGEDRAKLAEGRLRMALAGYNPPKRPWAREGDPTQGYARDAERHWLGDPPLDPDRIAHALNMVRFMRGDLWADRVLLSGCEPQAETLWNHMHDGLSRDRWTRLDQKELDPTSAIGPEELRRYRHLMEEFLAFDSPYDLCLQGSESPDVSAPTCVGMCSVGEGGPDLPAHSLGTGRCKGDAKLISVTILPTEIVRDPLLPDSASANGSDRGDAGERRKEQLSRRQVLMERRQLQAAPDLLQGWRIEIIEQGDVTNVSSLRSLAVGWRLTPFPWEGSDRCHGAIPIYSEVTTIGPDRDSVHVDYAHPDGALPGHEVYCPVCFANGELNERRRNAGREDHSDTAAGGPQPQFRLLQFTPTKPREFTYTARHVAEIPATWLRRGTQCSIRVRSVPKCLARREQVSFFFPDEWRYAGSGAIELAGPLPNQTREDKDGSVHAIAVFPPLDSGLMPVVGLEVEDAAARHTLAVALALMPMVTLLIFSVPRRKGGGPAPVIALAQVGLVGVLAVAFLWIASGGGVPSLLDGRVRYPPSRAWLYAFLFGSVFSLVSGLAWWWRSRVQRVAFVQERGPVSFELLHMLAAYSLLLLGFAVMAAYVIDSMYEVGRLSDRAILGLAAVGPCAVLIYVVRCSARVFEPHPIAYQMVLLFAMGVMVWIFRTFEPLGNISWLDRFGPRGFNEALYAWLVTWATAVAALALCRIPQLAPARGPADSIFTRWTYYRRRHRLWWGRAVVLGLQVVGSALTALMLVLEVYYFLVSR